ncbi:hypothetical protein EDC04DRAFT_852040 [Pisolithus marmoratus]|nr:hypothetical protein EDC04DRAFT_852040 [Pisolithus marmoratus]
MLTSWEVQNENQFSACSSEPFPCDRVSSDDSQTPQYYVGPATSSVSILANATRPPPTAKKVAIQNQNQFDYGPSQLHLRDRVPSEDNQAPQHYRDFSTSISSIVHALVPPQTANNETVLNQNQVTSCHSQPCLYNQNGNTCAEPVTCDTMAEHFGAMHDVKRMGREDQISCQWPNCGRKVRRHNFARHIREMHLQHKRR